MFTIDRRVLHLLWITLGIKLLVAHFLPMTGDEAYFIVWGKHPDFGFYDHTPLAGWFLTAMLAFSDAELWLRLPQILTTSFIGLSIYLLVRRQHESTAVMVAVLYMLAPINILGVMMTTDTPILLFSFISAVCFYKAQRNDNKLWYLLSGLFLGLAFFSKFFAGLLGIAYVVYVLLFVRRGSKPWQGIALVILGTLPFIGINIWWNYNHCWNNYLFNFYNRTSGGGFSLITPLKYLATLLYLASPPIIYYLARHSKDFYNQLRTDRFSIFMGLFLIPYGLFLLLSFRVSIGLHWLLSFYPFIFIAIATVFSAQQLRRTFYFMLPFSVLHLVAFAVLVVLSPGMFKKNENTYKDVVYGMYADEIYNKVKQLVPGYIIATDSYTESALLSYAAREHIIVMGLGSHHARQDDQITDFRTLDGKDIVVIAYVDKFTDYNKYFESIEIKSLPIAETNYYYLIGKGFKYSVYRDTVLKEVMKRFYTAPDYFPVGQCYMFDKYATDNK